MIINIDLNGREFAQAIDDECVLVDLDVDLKSAVYFHGTVDQIRRFAEGIIGALAEAPGVMAEGEGEVEVEEDGEMDEVELGLALAMSLPTAPPAALVLMEAPASAWERDW